MLLPESGYCLRAVLSAGESEEPLDEIESLKPTLPSTEED